MSSAYPIAFVMFLLVAMSLAYLIPDRDGPVAAPTDADVDEADERLATDDDMVAIRGGSTGCLSRKAWSQTIRSN